MPYDLENLTADADLSGVKAIITALTSEKKPPASDPRGSHYLKPFKDAAGREQKYPWRAADDVLKQTVFRCPIPGTREVRYYILNAEKPVAETRSAHIFLSPAYLTIDSKAQTFSVHKSPSIIKSASRGGDKFYLESAQHEASMTSQLLGACYHQSRDLEGHCLVMPIVKGFNLDKAYTDRRLDPTNLIARFKLSLRIAMQIYVLHANDFFHGDLNPSNTHCTTDLAVKFVDHAFSGGAYEKGSPRNSIRYAALELLKGKPNSCEADIYAFGIVLLQLWKDAQSLLADQFKGQNGFNSSNALKLEQWHKKHGYLPLDYDAILNDRFPAKWRQQKTQLKPCIESMTHRHANARVTIQQVLGVLISIHHNVDPDNHQNILAELKLEFWKSCLQLAINQLELAQREPDLDPRIADCCATLSGVKDSADTTSIASGISDAKDAFTSGDDSAATHSNGGASSASSSNSSSNGGAISALFKAFSKLSNSSSPPPSRFDRAKDIVDQIEPSLQAINRLGYSST